MGILVTKNNLQEVVTSIKNYVDNKSGAIEVQEWTPNSNANDYTETGVYQFAGWRKNPNDNLPITNYDEDDVDRNNIAFTLIVNTKDGYLLRNDEGNVTRNIPTMIAQTLMLGNRRGSDTKIYTRHGQTNLATNTTTWEAWREVMTSTYLGTVDSYTGDVLNATTEIGLYTGAMVDMASNTADVFKLEVINNYAVTTQVSGASIPNSVLQTITILDLNGNNTTKKRTGTYGDSGYTWSEWKENASATPDWNQNDENAADYIKNRTHYEYIDEHKEFTDEEYNAEIKNEKTFTPVKVNSITINTNEFLKIDSNIQVGVQEDYDKLLEGIYIDGPYKQNSNSTGISPIIVINGKAVKLNWFIKTDESSYYAPVETPDGLDSVLYGIHKIKSGPDGIYIYADGFILKDYSYAEKFNGVNMTGYHGTSSVSTFLIDKTVYGEAPYTIDFYFECEQIIKKLDEKFIPDSVLPKAPKYKIGDVVYCTNVPNFHFGVMSWEEYKTMPTNSMDTKLPIGLVVDPVKRTFLFCELLDKYFATSDNIETYFGGYTSFEDGAETFERIIGLIGNSNAADIPAFYELRDSGHPSGSIFYVKNDSAYVPAIEEWKIAKEHLCTAFYGDDNSYAGFMDRLIALRDGITPSSSLFIGINTAGLNKLFYSQISTVGKINSNSGALVNAAYNMNGDIPFWDNATDQYACCPVFGIYTEEEENA